MNRSELILQLRDKLPKHEAKLIDAGVRSVFHAITNALANGERVEIRDFAIFSTKEFPQRMARNPKTGDAVMIHAKRRVHFKQGKELKETVNHGKD